MKSVHWSTPVVSEVHVVPRVTKKQVCGTKGKDNWKHFAEIRAELDKNMWNSRTLTIDDLDDL